MRETPFAISTGVRPFSGVNSAVNLKCPGLAKALAAVGAAVWTGACVYVEVDAQIAVRVECTAALGAQEAAGFGRMLCSLVLQQLRRPGERGIAVHAWELLQAFLLCVALLMAEELGAGGEGALAGQAREGRERT